jgi:hypothetical protein
MSASDIPDCQRHRSGEDMARSLVKYLSDAAVIRQAILREFGRSPTERTISQLRAEHLARQQRPLEAPHKPHEGYYPRDAADSLTRINAAFLARLEAERAVSRAGRTELTDRHLYTDLRWDADIRSAVAVAA